jgi:putative salt-induced outer membrane protein
MTPRASLFALLVIGCAAPAAAELPQPVRAMIDAAIATGDARTAQTVVTIARQTNPEDVAEIDALWNAFVTRQSELAAAQEVSRQEALRNAGLFDNWSGRGQIGAFQSTGNSDMTGVTVALALQRTGIDWEHRLRATADYQRSNGRTSREQYLVAWEPRYQIGEDLFAFGLAQYDSDRFQGFSSRYSLSGGLGYRLIDSSSARLDLKAGPAWRQVEYVDGSGYSSFGALAGVDFSWQLAKPLRLTQNADLVTDAGGSAVTYIDSNNVSIVATTGLEAAINSRLTTRVSYTIDYDSNPPPRAVSTDTLSRFTLVYAF